MARPLGDWEASEHDASTFVDCARATGLVDGAQRCWRLRLRGVRENTDTLAGAAGRIPALVR